MFSLSFFMNNNPQNERHESLSYLINLRVPFPYFTYTHIHDDDSSEKEEEEDEI